MRNVRGTRGHHDPVERGELVPADRPVPDLDEDVLVPEVLDRLLGAPAQRLDALDGEHPVRKLRKEGGLVARPRADLEHRLVAREPELLRHERDHERLRDRLALADREGVVTVRRRLHARPDEQMSRHLPHRAEDALVCDPARNELALDHLDALGLPVGHSPSSPVPRACASMPILSSGHVLRASIAS